MPRNRSPTSRAWARPAASNAGAMMFPRARSTDFYRATQAKDDETPIFSWIEYPDKATRDAANKKMSENADMANMQMPFDGKRMFWGGFEQIVNE